MDDQPITTNPYTVTFADYARQYVWAYIRAFTTFPRNLYMIALMMLLPVLVNFQAMLAHHFTGFGFWTLAMIGVWTVVIPLITLLSFHGNLRRNKTLTGKRTATISDSGFTLIGTGFRTEQIWASFKEIREARTAFYLITQTRLSYIVLKSAFDSPVTATAFFAQARVQIANVKHKHVKAFFQDTVDAPPMEGLAAPPFVLTFRLYAVYYMQILLRAFLMPAVLIPVIAAWFGLPVWLGRRALEEGHWQILLPVFGSLAIFVALFVPLMTVISWLTAANKPATKGLRHISLTSEVLYARGDTYDVRIIWADINRVTIGLGLILFWVGRAGVLVPLSAFADKSAAKAFYDTAITYWTAARTSAA